MAWLTKTGDMLIAVSVQIAYKLNARLSLEFVCLSDFTKFTLKLKSILTSHLYFSDVVMDVNVRLDIRKIG